MSSTIHVQYLIVPAESDVAGQCRIVCRHHSIKHETPLTHYRQYPEQWSDVGLMASNGTVRCLDAPSSVWQAFWDCEPLMASVCISESFRVDDAELVRKVGQAFSALLEQTVGPLLIEKIAAANRDEKSPGVCHSHDYCDANVLMAQALRSLTGIDAAARGAWESPEVAALWNGAWDFAKTNGFRASSVVREDGSAFSPQEDPGPNCSPGC